MKSPKVVLFANTDWYLYNFRLSLACKLREYGFEVILLSPDGEYGPRLRELGFRWLAVPMNRRSLNPLRELSLIMWLTRFFDRESPQIVHGFTIKCAVYGSLAGRFSRVPVRIGAVAGMGYVFTSRDMKARMLKPLVRRMMRAALSGQGSALILQNPDDVELFESADIVDRQSIRLIRGSGVDLARFTVRAVEHVGAPEPLCVLLAARLLWDKGIAEYVDAARMLKRESRNVRFLLAGLPDAGNPAAVRRELVEGWVGEGLVEWLGHVGDMPQLLSEVDVMVLPSYREGLPKALIEAAACGIALITTDAPGCREVVSRTGVDGISIPVRDSEALAGAIRLLDDDRALARKLGLAARDKALKQFDERIVIDKTLAVYRELMPTFP
ncbi:Lipid carrier : UDP-N-acetylgalactosaminyltransferase / Alpha-1,3-N-acetylgalactosamine transferase PglA; Putative glycosyltransferase [Caballeronia glathei]|uniref:Glycosyl transferase family 1 n=1 Tax=Caballeronia glathei TaxID=60547 RepID=A0A069PGA8_9BURK|nr:glycosyltransferase family 4 protein [Caballeronia glathei]KDR39703.1 glycosyl transferase family 1 [Caballeronia glathei]CDY74786.1 Lipid carrier : UDP-N-acetylgalactosaminyltransferase / Alpha-1,3-N-acetylgalactosamine transferase PglA; Putative glycosyltransferase [Caballeronia glathei]